MQKNIYTFERVEKKYLVSREKAEMLKKELAGELVPDSHGINTVNSLYLDNDSFLLIRNSIEAEAYKEKLRIRCYGDFEDDKTVFFEIKKKFKGVVYKRRVSMPYSQALEYVFTGKPPLDSQIMREIDYAMKVYRDVKPRVLISCEREAYFFSSDPTLRLTIDYGIRYSTLDGKAPTPIISDTDAVMELKSSGSIPVWLSLALERCGIYPTRFSKYAHAYYDITKKRKYINMKR